MEGNGITVEKKPNPTLRVIVIGIIIILLILLSIGIVKIVPKMLNALANASLSLGSLLDTRKATSTDPSTNTNTQATSTGNSTGNGFSIHDLTNLQNSGNNYVPSASNAPAPVGLTSGNTYTPTSPSYSPTSPINSSTTNSAAGTNTNTPSTNTSTKNTTGASDIAVQVIAKGIISKSNGAFIETNTFSTNDMVAIKFKIENRGQYATGPWALRVDMPSTIASEQVKILSNNKSLPAGVAITGIAKFNSPKSGNPSVTITADINNTTQDTNIENNTATIPLNVSVSY